MQSGSVRSLEQSFVLADGGYRREMNAQRAVAVRTEYYARPRRAIVVSDLATLRGPSGGTVELPLRLYWSGPSPVFVDAHVIEQGCCSGN